MSWSTTHKKYIKTGRGCEKLMIGSKRKGNILWLDANLVSYKDNLNLLCCNYTYCVWEGRSSLVTFWQWTIRTTAVPYSTPFASSWKCLLYILVNVMSSCLGILSTSSLPLELCTNVSQYILWDLQKSGDVTEISKCIGFFRTFIWHALHYSLLAPVQSV